MLLATHKQSDFCSVIIVKYIHYTYSSYLILDQYSYSAESRGRFRLRSTLSPLVRILLPSGVAVEEESSISEEEPLMRSAR